MREIRYRAKSIFDGRWVYGLPRIRDGLNHILIEESNGAGHDADPDTLGEWTGCKSKSGVDIYEGDIVKHLVFDIEEINQIKWDKDHARFLPRADEGSFPAEDFEILGNIYENPDLLNNS